MLAWVIVPKGRGDIAERLQAVPDAAIEVTLFLDPEKAYKTFEGLQPPIKAKSEVRQVEITIVAPTGSGHEPRA